MELLPTQKIFFFYCKNLRFLPEGLNNSTSLLTLYTLFCPQLEARQNHQLPPNLENFSILLRPRLEQKLIREDNADWLRILSWGPWYSHCCLHSRLLCWLLGKAILLLLLQELLVKVQELPVTFSMSTIIPREICWCLEEKQYSVCNKTW